MSGKQVRLFLVDGTVGGLMTAEILNWTGHVLRGRRKDLGEIKNREEAQRTGVYILFGPDDEGELTAYIGEGDNVVARLIEHDAKKDFWEDVVIISSKDMNLTKAHVRYLESELVRLAKSIGRVKLVNGNNPSGGAALPEADESDMQYFMNQIKILMPVLGFDIFRGRPTLAVASRDTDSLIQPQINPIKSEEEDLSATPNSPVFYATTRLGCNARAQIIDGEFTVLQGSVIHAQMRKKPNISAATQRQFDQRRIQHNKVLGVSEPGPTSKLATLLKDFVFSSPSAAAAVVYARASSNGRIEWKTVEGRTFKEWEESQAAAI